MVKRYTNNTICGFFIQNKLVLDFSQLRIPSHTYLLEVQAQVRIRNKGRNENVHKIISRKKADQVRSRDKLFCLRYCQCKTFNSKY